MKQLVPELTWAYLVFIRHAQKVLSVGLWCNKVGQASNERGIEGATRTSLQPLPEVRVDIQMERV
jgi:hypothetical protein